MTDPAVVSEWVEASCASQGLPLRVADLGILADVAGLLGATPGAGRAAHHRTAQASGAPDGSEAAGVEAVVAAPSGSDDDVIDNRGDDRGLAG